MLTAIQSDTPARYSAGDLSYRALVLFEHLMRYTCMASADLHFLADIKAYSKNL